MKSCYRVQDAIAQGMLLNEHEFLLTAIGTQNRSRGQGYAQQVLDQVLADADAEKVTVLLAVHPDPNTDEARLRSWYKRNGFTDYDLDPVGMVRKPMVRESK